MKKTYRFIVQVESDYGIDTVRQCLDNLIEIGLADAADTLAGQDTGGDTFVATVATSSDWHSPEKAK